MEGRAYFLTKKPACVKTRCMRLCVLRATSGSAFKLLNKSCHISLRTVWWLSFLKIVFPRSRPWDKDSCKHNYEVFPGKPVEWWGNGPWKGRKPPHKGVLHGAPWKGTLETVWGTPQIVLVRGKGAWEFTQIPLSKDCPLTGRKEIPKHPVLVNIYHFIYSKSRSLYNWASRPHMLWSVPLYWCLSDFISHSSPLISFLSATLASLFFLECALSWPLHGDGSRGHFPQKFPGLAPSLPSGPFSVTSVRATLISLF